MSSIVYSKAGADAALLATARLKSTAVLSSSVAPVLNTISKYDATAASRTPTLPALAGLAEGEWYGVQKTDSTTNTVTITAAGADTFDSGATALTLRYAELRVLQVVVIAGNKFWKVVSGNTPQSSVDAQIAATAVPVSSGVLGAELVSNGDFATNLTGWTGANWTWASGKATHAAGSLAPLVQAGTPAVVGQTYFISFTVSSLTAGAVFLYFGGVYITITSGTNGTRTGWITATSTDPLQIVPTDDLFVGSIDDVSVKAMTSTSIRVDNDVRFTKPLNFSGALKSPPGMPIAIGYNALPANSTGTYNIAASNVAIGYQAGYNNSTGHVTVVGYRAGEANTDGVLTAFGKWAGLSNTTGHTTLFGNAAGRSNTTGNIDVFGDEAGALNTSGTIAAFGYYAAHTNTTGTVTAIGHQAGDTAQGDAIYTAIGHFAGRAITGQGATLVGHTAGQAVLGGRATGVGHEALRNTTSGNATSVGYRAGYANTTGAGTFIGYQAGLGTTTGRVTALGNSAALEVTTGDLIAIGHQAGYGTVTANAVGTDTQGILIGDFAGRSVAKATVLSNYVGIGHDVRIDKSNQVKLGNTSITETVLQGGVILGKLTTAQKTALTATDGMVLYDTDLGKFQGREAGAWVNLI